MAETSKFVLLNSSVLLEYQYNDTNLLADQYKILINSQTNQQSYIAGPSSITNNTQTNSLFQINSVTNTYGLVNTTQYNFLQTKNYASGVPNLYDTVNIHFPTNYTFGQYIGCYIRVYTVDFNNQIIYELSNFFYDQTNTSTTGLMNFASPPLMYQETLWGKYLQIQVPSIYGLSNQRTNGSTTPNTINYNLTNGTGLSINAPIFIDFRFLAQNQVINGITTYITTAPVTVSFPQTPDFYNLGVMIQEADDGDYFQIYGTFDGDIGAFDTFITNAVQTGNNYYVQYSITVWEQNIQGTTLVVTVTQNFGEPVMYRPIIQYSTTTAIIDVEMLLIDANTNSSISRNASYGMLQDEVSKYSLYLMKINLQNANTPIIYNVKNPMDPSSILNARNSGTPNSSSNSAYTFPQVQIETIQLPFPVMIDRYNIIAKSDSVTTGSTQWWGIGKLQIMIYPFDNVFKIIIATSINTANNSPKYMDLSNMGTISMVIKNSQTSVSFALYTDTGEVNLTLGFLVFKIPSSSINNVRTIYNAGVNLFYITTSNNNITTVIYTGIFQMYDSNSNVATLNNIAANAATQNSSSPTSIINDNSITSGTAIVTRIATQGVTSPASTSSLPKLVPIVSPNIQAGTPAGSGGTGKLSI